MDIVTELTGMLNMPLLILGLLIGFVVKHLVSDETIQNKYIPVINVIVGSVLGVVLAIGGGAAVTAEAILLAVISSSNNILLVSSTKSFISFLLSLN